MFRKHKLILILLFNCTSVLLTVPWPCFFAAFTIRTGNTFSIASADLFWKSILHLSLCWLDYFAVLYKVVKISSTCLGLNISVWLNKYFLLFKYFLSLVYHDIKENRKIVLCQTNEEDLVALKNRFEYWPPGGNI